MKSNESKINTRKSYICNSKNRRTLSCILVLLLISLAMLIVLAGCDTSSSSEMPSTETKTETTTETEVETGAEKEAIETAKTRSLNIASEYHEIYANAEKTTSEYFPYQTVLSQETKDEIEDFLCEQGYPVMDSDKKYPTHLENSNGVYEFWKSVSENKDTEQVIITVSESGGLYYDLLELMNGEKRCTSVFVDWNENNEPFISSADQREVLDWELTEHGDFYYQIYPSDMHYDDYMFIRLEQVDKELYDLNDKYIMPIGYQSNNLFLCDWSSADYGDVCFNDLLEFLFKMNTKEYFYAKDYPFERSPYLHSCIPANIFEDTILPYFDISLQDFRERTLYDKENGYYPWREICCDNLIYFPSVEPEVVDQKINDDGTFTLIVHARCNDYKTDKLFTHELTIQPLENGGFHYIGNKITYVGDYGFPPNDPRLPPQRSNHTEE